MRKVFVPCGKAANPRANGPNYNSLGQRPRIGSSSKRANGPRYRQMLRVRALEVLGRAFSPRAPVCVVPGALPQAVMGRAFGATLQTQHLDAAARRAP